jgi:predicted nucleic acid-binding protein
MLDGSVEAGAFFFIEFDFDDAFEPTPADHTRHTDIETLDSEFPLTQTGTGQHALLIS